MQSDNVQPGRFRRTVNDLVMAEMFLVQATIESATAIGDGISPLSRQLTAADGDDVPQEPLASLLQRTADEAVEPYTSRVRVLLRLRDSDD
jgi:hypothetical protein